MYGDGNHLYNYHEHGLLYKLIFITKITLDAKREIRREKRVNYDACPAQIILFTFGSGVSLLLAMMYWTRFSDVSTFLPA